MPCTTLAHYRIESLLGTGGMGETWLALESRIRDGTIPESEARE
jgi:hypothetical protein